MSSNQQRGREKKFQEHHVKGNVSDTDNKTVNTVIPNLKGQKGQLLKGEGGLNFAVEGERKAVTKDRLPAQKVTQGGTENIMQNYAMSVRLKEGNDGRTKAVPSHFGGAARRTQIEGKNVTMHKGIIHQESDAESVIFTEQTATDQEY